MVGERPSSREPCATATLCSVVDALTNRIVTAPAFTVPVLGSKAGAPDGSATSRSSDDVGAAASLSASSPP